MNLSECQVFKSSFKYKKINLLKSSTLILDINFSFSFSQLKYWLYNICYLISMTLVKKLNTMKTISLFFCCCLSSGLAMSKSGQTSGSISHLDKSLPYNSLKLIFENLDFAKNRLLLQCRPIRNIFFNFEFININSKNIANIRFFPFPFIQVNFSSFYCIISFTVH